MSMTGGLKAAPGGVAPADDARSWPQRFLARFLANVAWGFAAIVRPPRAQASAAWRDHRRVAVGTLAVAFAIAASMLLLDRSLAEAVRHLPSWLVAAFGQVTDFGKSAWFLWPIGVGLFAMAAMSSPGLGHVGRLTLAALAVRASFLFVAIALPGSLVAIVKRVIGRARPFVGNHVDPFLYKLLVWRPDYASMPSGHATTAFAAMVAIGLIWPRLRAPMLIYALVIAASRVVLDAHYLSDVIAGAAVGAVGALMVRDWFAARRLGFVIGPDGRVRPLPGPKLARIKRVARSLIAS